MAYQQGRLDAYEDVLAWMVKENSENGFKNIPTNKFKEFLSARINAQQKEWTSATTH